MEITGTTTITSLGTGYIGCRRELRFSGILTLTNSANLSIGGANITTAVGDVGTFRCIASGQWVLVAYSRNAAGTGYLPLTGGTLTGALVVGGNVTAIQNFVSSTVNANLATTGDGTVFLRPRGVANGSAQTTVQANGNMTVANGVIAGGPVSATTTVSDALGNVRTVPLNTQNATYSLVAADAGKSVTKTDASAYAWTLPPATFVAGQVVTFCNDGSAGNVTLTRGGGVALMDGTVDANVTLLPG